MDDIVLNFNIHLWKIPPKLNKLKKVLKENLHKTIFLKKKTITFTHSWTRGKMKTFRKNQWADFDQNQDVYEFSTRKSPKRSSLCIIKVVPVSLPSQCLSSHELSNKSNEQILWNFCLFVFLDPTLPPCWFSLKVACVVNLKLVFTD